MPEDDVQSTRKVKISGFFGEDYEFDVPAEMSPTEVFGATITGLAAAFGFYPPQCLDDVSEDEVSP